MKCGNFVTFLIGKYEVGNGYNNKMLEEFNKALNNIKHNTIA
jgi:hypothetical protein